MSRGSLGARNSEGTIPEKNVSNTIRAFVKLTLLLIGDYSRNDIFFFAINANWKFGKPSEAPSTEEK